MKVICARCKKRVRDIEPLDDPRESHGICKLCMDKVWAQAAPAHDVPCFDCGRSVARGFAVNGLCPQCRSWQRARGGR